MVNDIAWKKKATENFDKIINYVADENEAAAEKLADTFLEKIEGLREFPNLYKKGRVIGTHEMNVGNYIVVYSVAGNVTTIESVLHGAQQYP